MATAISVSSTTFVVITDRALSTLLLKSFHEYCLGTFTFLTVATDAMEHFQEEVMGRKEAYNFFAKISSPPILHKEIDGNDANFPRIPLSDRDEDGGLCTVFSSLSDSFYE